MDSIENTITFVLFKEYKIYGAISNDILRRAIGASIFANTTLLLIKCTREFVLTAIEYCRDFNVKIIDCLDINECKFHSDYIVTHTWPETLYSVSEIFGIENLILIEETIPLIDRFKKPHIKQSFKDMILTTNPMLKIITKKYRKYIKHARKYVAISNDQAGILVNRYSVTPNFISYDPIDTRFFKYEENSLRDSLLVFNNLWNSPQFTKIVDSCKGIGVSNIICIGGNKVADSLNGLKIEYIESYTFKEISEIYSRAMLTITDEANGSFELIPIESLASGVPVITPDVPSINIVRGHLLYQENPPFFNYFSFLNGNLETLISWYSKMDKMRQSFSSKSSEFFSMENVAKEFLLNLKSD